MIDPVVAFVGGVLFLAGVVVGANWHARGRRRRALPLPGERARRVA